MTATKRALPETATRDRRSREAADFDSQLHLCNIERPTHRTDRWAQGQSAIVSDVPDRNAHLRLFNCRVLIAASSLAQSNERAMVSHRCAPGTFPLISNPEQRWVIVYPTTPMFLRVRCNEKPRPGWRSNVASWHETDLPGRPDDVR
jgi:hypothetical protein